MKYNELQHDTFIKLSSLPYTYIVIISHWMIEI